MTHKIADLLFSQLSEFIADRMGLYFPQWRRRDLERGINSAAREFGFQAAETCAQWLLSSSLTKDQIEILASHLTVGETYFFREDKSFEILRRQILPELIDSRSRTEPSLRIWSAGCCTGEEPYSIAILLSRLLPNLQDWKVSILATDINPHFLQKASDGVYSNWSFRETPQWVQGEYFNQMTAGRFELLPEIKKMVTFSYLNLAEEIPLALRSHTSELDLIFCRNVLMYFAPGRAKRVIQTFYRSLANSGWLIVSPSELSQTLFRPFVTVSFPDTFFYRKDSQDHPAKYSIDEPDCETASWPSLNPISDLALSSALSSSLNAILPVPCDPELDPAGGFNGPIPPGPEEPEQEDARVTAYREARARYEQGCYEAAAACLFALLSENQGDVEAMMLLARVYANQGQLAEARLWCEKAISIDRLSEGAHYLRAVILQEERAFEEAEESLKRALYLDPNFTLAHFALGNLSLRRGEIEEASRHFRNALSLLQRYGPEDFPPESEKLTAGRLAEIIRLTIGASHEQKQGGAGSK